MDNRLSDFERKELKRLSEQTHFLLENLVDCYLISRPDNNLWSEEKGISEFIKWCSYAVIWGYKNMPTSGEDRLRLIKAVQEADKNNFTRRTQDELYELTARHQQKLELIKGVLEYSYMSIKSLILINGGAIIAILTLIQTIWKDDKNLTSLMMSNLSYFVYGIIVAVIVSFLSYLTQAIIVEVCKDNKWFEFAKKLRMAAVLCAVFSLGFFSCGAFSTIYAVANHTPIQTIKPL